MEYNASLYPMSLLRADKLTKAYGAQDVFTGVTAGIPKGARIALVGPNGIGKTTLLRLFVGLDTPDQGTVHRSRNLKIGYLPQETSFSKSRKEDLQRTLWEFCLIAFKELIQQEKKLSELEAEMADPGRSAAVLEKYGELQTEFEESGGYTYPYRTRYVLNGFGLGAEYYDTPLSDLSGGERTRAHFAQLLLQNPTILILDEPTNHLDIRAIEWLEKWLSDWDGAALIVSHDRYFLDRTVNLVWELTQSGIDRYRGNFSAYVDQRDERRKLRSARFNQQQAFIQKEEAYIQKNIAAQNTNQAKGRRKRLQRLLRDHRLEQPKDSKHVRIDFIPEKRTGNIVAESHDLEIGHPGTSSSLFHIPDFLLSRGECVAIMGPNGAGKTTFLRTLLGELPPYAGELRLGASLQIGYFAQAHQDLNPDQSVIEELMSVDSSLREAEARNYLAAFLFVGDEVFKPIDSLSGGERGRIALAKLIREGANVLMLDEPTNHLDIPSQEILQSSLAQFSETILLVSHDRYLIDRLATQIWEIIPEEERMVIFRGSYTEYKAIKSSKTAVPAQKKRKTRRDPGKSSKHDQSLELLESRIMEIEQELARIATKITIAGSNISQVRDLGEAYTVLESELQSKLDDWERLSNAT
jgi:ATP-binding cassette subfamily F protein 3